MRSILYRAGIGITTATFIAGCASNYQAVDNSYIGSQKSATIILSPSDVPIYRQIVDDDKRVAEVEFSAFQEGMAASGSLAASYGVFHWGTQALSTTPSAAGGAAVAVPGLGLGIAALATATGAAVDSYRYGRAEDSVARHKQLLHGQDLDEFARTIVASSLSEFSHLQVATVTGVDDWVTPVPDADQESGYQSIVSSLKASLATERAASGDTLETVLEQIDSDFVVTLAYFPQFSPNFEVLELHAVVSVYDRESATPQEPVYSNTVYYQSEPHAGLYLADTRQVNDEFMEQYRQKAVWRETRAGRDKLSDHQKLAINDQMRQKRHVMERNYMRLDKHDPYGELWLQDDGQPMFIALQEGLREVVRLVVYDLNADHSEADLEARTLPGTALEMRFVDTVSNDKRHIYRSDSGALHSVGAQSRFVLYEPVD